MLHELAKQGHTDELQKMKAQAAAQWLPLVNAMSQVRLMAEKPVHDIKQSIKGSALEK
jgi:hypothetical protein